LRDLFVPGEDLAIYDDRSLVDVARTLLDHPELRTRMAESGRKKVLEAHTYLHRARTILSTLESSLERRSFVPEGADHDEHTHV
jgi:spore maturation protein CgeB